MSENSVETVVCHTCSQVMVTGTETTGPDNEPYCSLCFDRHFILCCECETYVSNDGITTVDEQHLCLPCFNDKYVYCSICDDVIPVDDATEHNGDYFCRSCFDDNHTQCDDCDEYVANDRAVSVGSDSICQHCYENHYFICDSCNEICNNDNYAEDGVCQYCHDESSGDECGDDNTGVHSHDYKPRPCFRKLENQLGPNEYIGIELELEDENNRGTPDITEGYFYMKHDGSLTRGVEIVSHPATWEWLQDNKYIWDTVLNLRKQGYRSYNTTTCGMHVHISKTAFSTFLLYKWLRFFVDNDRFVRFFSQRTPSSMSWCKMDDKGEIIRKAKEKKNATGRYEAINLQNRDTVEIRIFRGTLNPTKFWANLEFIKALSAFLDPIPAKDIAKGLAAQFFVKYVMEHKELYPNLSAWLSDKETELKDC
jgi:hypothetical protein